MILNPNSLDIGFTISPALNGKTFWDLSIDGKLIFPSTGEWTITPNQDIPMDIKMWGAGGAAGTYTRYSDVNISSYNLFHSPGGPGGFTKGVMIFRKDISYIVRVGQGGDRTIVADAGGATYLAGGQPRTGQGGSQGGGYSGIFKTSVTQGNAMLMAGGGGGGGGPFGASQIDYVGGTSTFAREILKPGGSGGGLSGGNTSANSGGTQVAGGTPNGSGSPTAGSALTGGVGGLFDTTVTTGLPTGNTDFTTNYCSLGAGGGGYFGGAGTLTDGGGGGSGRVGTDSDILNGFTIGSTTPAATDQIESVQRATIPPYHLDPDNGGAGIAGYFPYNKRGADGKIVMEYFPEIKDTFSITPALNRKTTWNLSTDGEFNVGVVGEYRITPYADITTNIKMWGGGGARGYSYTQGITSTANQGNGGSGGYTTGTVVLKRGATYILRIGEGGARTITINDGARFHKGGVGSVFGGTEGGGYTGLFKNYTNQSGAILIAGGGGAGGDTAFGTAVGGGGGLTGGSAITDQGGQGGTQISGGPAGAYNNPSAGSALAGGSGQRNITTNASLGGGGGGYFGGGGGNVGGGGGGSGFVSTDPDVTSASTTGASGNTPANSTDWYRSGAGQGGNSTIGTTGSDGRLIISKNATASHFSDVIQGPNWIGTYGTAGYVMPSGSPVNLTSLRVLPSWITNFATDLNDDLYADTTFANQPVKPDNSGSNLFLIATSSGYIDLDINPLVGSKKVSFYITTDANAGTNNLAIRIQPFDRVSGSSLVAPRNYNNTPSGSNIDTFGGMMATYQMSGKVRVVFTGIGGFGVGMIHGIYFD